MCGVSLLSRAVIQLYILPLRIQQMEVQKVISSLSQLQAKQYPHCTAANRMIFITLRIWLPGTKDHPDHVEWLVHGLMDSMRHTTQE